jgi:hypothetical protein
MKLKIGSGLMVIDSTAGAVILDQQDKVIASYPAGSFFKGLMRPWYGIHTIDTVRRDAVESRIPFKLENINFQGYDYEKRVITLYDAPGFKGLQFSVAIDIDKNQIDKIEFRQPAAGGKTSQIGSLEFTYPVHADPNAPIAEMPEIKPGRAAKDPGIAWLFKLADGTLGK